jgi:hypothetical protein
VNYTCVINHSLRRDSRPTGPVLPKPNACPFHSVVECGYLQASDT